MTSVNPLGLRRQKSETLTSLKAYKKLNDNPRVSQVYLDVGLSIISLSVEAKFSKARATCLQILEAYKVYPTQCQGPLNDTQDSASAQHSHTRSLWSILWPPISSHPVVLGTSSAATRNPSSSPGLFCAALGRVNIQAESPNFKSRSMT